MGVAEYTFDSDFFFLPLSFAIVHHIQYCFQLSVVIHIFLVMTSYLLVGGYQFFVSCYHLSSVICHQLLA